VKVGVNKKGVNKKMIFLLEERLKGMKINKPKRIKLKIGGCKLISCALGKERYCKKGIKTRPLILNRKNNHAGGAAFYLTHL